MKISILAQGEVASGTYVLGVLGALKDYFRLKRVDYVSGSSGSLGPLAYYISGGFSYNPSTWAKWLSSYKVVNLKNLLNKNPIVDVDYIVNNLLKKKFKVTQKKLKKSKTKFIVPLTNAKTGKVEYFNNHMNLNFFEILRAGMAAPFSYGKTVKINGCEYFDGAYGDPIPINVPGIQNSKKIIILTKPEVIKLNWIERNIAYILKKKFDNGEYKAIHNKNKLYQKKLKYIKKLEERGEAIVIHFSKGPFMFDNRIKSLKYIIKKGYEDAKSHEEIRELIKL